MLTPKCLVVILLLGLPLLVGCPLNAVSSMGTPSDRKVEKEFDLQGKAVVVIPFKDASQPYFESRDGVDLAQLVSSGMGSKVTGVRMLSPEPIRKNYDPATLEEVGVARIASSVGADYLLVGNLRKFTIRDPGVVGVFHGTCTIDLKLLDAARETTAWESSITVYYPPYGEGVPDTMPAGSFRERLLSQSADTIVKKFYTHLERIEPPRSSY